MANLLNNQYQIIKALGNSRSSPAFLAKDTQASGRHCVVKQLNTTAYSPEKAQQLHAKFSQEAKRLEAASKGNSQIPNLYGYFAQEGLFYWVREWIEGRPLKDFASSPWSEKQASAFLISALNALAHLHRQNIVHLNLKPSNIIVREADKHPCLAGIGSKALKAIASEKPIMVRTAGFTAPEQTMGRPTMSSDIYSLSMTAIHLLTAIPPLKIPTDKNNGRLLWQQFAPNVSDLPAEGLSHRFAGVLTRAIHPSATIRFPSAANMLSVLQQPAPTQVASPNPAKSPAKKASSAASSTVVASHTILPQARTPQVKPQKVSTPQALEETVVSPPSARPAAAAVQASAKTSVVPQAKTSTATAITPRPPASTNPPAHNPKNKIYDPNNTNGALLQQPFFKWWAGLLVASLGIGALALLGANTFGFLRTASGIDASSPEILEETISALEEKVEDNPNDEKASLELIDAYLYGGDVQAADGVIDDLLDEDDTNTNALYQQGRLQFYQSDYTGAIASLEEAVEQDNRNGQAVVMLGRAYQEIGDYDSARSQFEAALSLSGQRGEAHLNLSYLNHLQGETQAALEEINAAARFFKGDDRIKIHTQRSTLYFDLRERERAQAEWEAAIALSPRNPEAYVTQSISKFFLGDSEGAIANLDQALAINPNFTEAHAMESLIHLNQGDIESAVTAIDEAVAIDEFSISALKIIADVALSTPEPNLDFALTAMDQALSINPNHPYILTQRCSYMLAVKETETAIENCTRSIEVNPNNVEAYNSRGQAHLSLFDFASAEADFTRIIEINEAVGRTPDAAAYAQRAAARTGLEDVDGAKEDLDRALEINSQE